MNQFNINNLIEYLLSVFLHYQKLFFNIFKFLIHIYCTNLIEINFYIKSKFFKYRCNKMKKIFGIFGIIVILLGLSFTTCSMGHNLIDNEENLELKALLVIGGTVNICTDEKELYGFGLIIYTDGETSFFERYSISYSGLPFFITKGLMLSVCIYIPDNI